MKKMIYSKTSQTSKKTRTHRICKKCDAKRLIKFFEKITSLICDDCKKKSRRVKKQSSIGKIKKKIEDLAKLRAKERDEWICQWCGKEVHGLNAHGSHVIPVSASQRLRFDLLNIKCLCYNCHFNKWHKNPNLASKWFQAKFPKRWAYLDKEQHNTTKWQRDELEALLTRYKL